MKSTVLYTRGLEGEGDMGHANIWLSVTQLQFVRNGGVDPWVGEEAIPKIYKNTGARV